MPGFLLLDELTCVLDGWPKLSVSRDIATDEAGVSRFIIEIQGISLFSKPDTDVLNDKLLPAWIETSLQNDQNTKDSKMESKLVFIKSGGDLVVGEIRQTKDSEKSIVLAEVKLQSPSSDLIEIGKVKGYIRSTSLAYPVKESTFSSSEELASIEGPSSTVGIMTLTSTSPVSSSIL